jgi:hypothetical protein
MTLPAREMLMIRIDLTTPKAKGEKHHTESKVIDLARARQDRRSSAVDFGKYHLDTDKYRAVLCADGNVYLELRHNGKHARQITVNASELEDLHRALLRLKVWQRQYNERQRGAHLWIARPHPERAGWLMVQHKDQDTAFKPVKVGARRSRSAMPKCNVCGKDFQVGEVAFDAQRAIHGCFGGLDGRPRICKGCTVPPREGMFEVLPDDVTATPD